MRRTAAVLSLLVLGACGGDKAPVATPSGSATVPAGCHRSAQPDGSTLIFATVKGNTVTTDHAVWSVKLGTAVRIAVLTDRADEVHVHEYDKKQDVVANCPTTIDFTANIPGTVEVELEGAKLHLFDLKAS
jgi:hypothetical protein